MSPHVLVLGATGPSGQVFCESALQQDYQITIYARSPSKLPDVMAKQSKVNVIQGGLGEQDKLALALQCGATILVSFLGPTGMGHSGTPITDFYEKLFPLLTQHKFRRVMILATPSYFAPQDQPSWKWTLGIGVIKLIGGSTFAEFSGIGTFVASWPFEGENALNWTVFRVPFLGNGDAQPVVASFRGSGLDGMYVNRKSVANWVLAEMKDGKEDWVGRAPCLSHS